MVKRDKWAPKKYSTICSKHFEQACLSNRGAQRVKLRSGSIPTLFMPTPGTVQTTSRAVPNDAEQQTPRTGRPRHVEPCNTQHARVAVAPLLASPVRPRGSALPCGPIKVTSGPSPVLPKCQVNITLGSDFNPVITRIKSEADPIKQEEDPQSDDTLSLAEDTDQLSDPDQPSEDLIPLSNTQVPLSNASDPLSDVKVEELEVGVDEVEVSGPEDVNRPMELARAVEGPTVPLPLHLKQELFLAGNDCYNLIRIQANQINKLSIRCGKHRQKLRSYVQIVRRRNKKISDLQAEVEALRNFIGGHGLEARSIGGGKLGAPRIQIQSSNTAGVQKKPNRQLLIVKRDHHRPKSLVTAQPTSDILQNSLLDALNTSDNLQKSSVGVKRTLNIQEKSSVSIPGTTDVLQKSTGGVKRTLNIQEKSSVAIQGTSGMRQTSTVGAKRMLDIRAESSVAGQNMSSIPKTRLIGLQRTSNINSQKSSVGVKRTTTSVNLQKSSSGIPGTSNVLQKSSVSLQLISDTNLQKSSAGDERFSDILNNPSAAVQPIPDIPQTSPVGFQRTSDIGQNALVIQIDGMHNTVLQPKLVRLEDNTMETG